MKKLILFMTVLTKKLKVIEILGGQCKNCGETDWEILTFHHKGDKSFTQNEFKKCDILCFNCHIKHHRKEMYAKYLKIQDYYGRVVKLADTQDLKSCIA